MNMPHDHIPGHAPHPEKKGHKRQKDEVQPEAEKGIDEGLQVIYGDDRSDLHTVHRDTSRLTRTLIRVVVALAALAVITFGSFFVYNRFFATDSDNRPLVMSIEVPPEVKSGDKIQMSVKYANPSKVPLASLELDINLPSSFRLVAAQPQPTNPEELVWNIGSLGTHSDGRITLEGVWTSHVPSATNVQVLARYKPANFNADFSDIVTETVTTLSSVLALEMTGPETGIPGQALSYKATITNTGHERVQDASFVLTMPPGFILSSSTPALQPGAEAKWVLAELAPEEVATVEWIGSFAADASDVQQLSGAVAVPEGERNLTQTAAQWFTDVAGSDLQVTLVANGSADKATTELGGVLRLSLRVQNAGTEDLQGASLLIDFQPETGVPLNWGSAVLAGGKVTADGVAFDETVVGMLAKGEKRTFNLSFPVKDVLAAGEVDTWKVTAFATMGEKKVQTAPVEVSLNARAEISATARYYAADSGAPLGDGPMPPKSGESTSYKIFWTIDPSVHALEKVVMTATLPPDVVWNERASASLGGISFDGTSQTVRWEIAEVSAEQAATAEFSVRLTPGDEDVGTFAKLLSGSSFRATDRETEASLEESADALTTELPTDSFAAGKGLVVD